jgi:hypothetical protein
LLQNNTPIKRLVRVSRSRCRALLFAQKLTAMAAQLTEAIAGGPKAGQ